MRYAFYLLAFLILASCDNSKMKSAEETSDTEEMEKNDKKKKNNKDEVDNTGNEDNEEDTGKEDDGEDDDAEDQDNDTGKWSAADKAEIKSKCIDNLLADGGFSKSEASEKCACAAGKAVRIFKSFDQLKNDDMSEKQERQWQDALLECGLKGVNMEKSGEH